MLDVFLHRPIVCLGKAQYTIFYSLPPSAAEIRIKSFPRLYFLPFFSLSPCLVFSKCNPQGKILRIQSCSLICDSISNEMHLAPCSVPGTWTRLDMWLPWRGKNVAPL